MNSLGNSQDSSWTTVSSVDDECGYSSCSLPEPNEMFAAKQRITPEDASLDDTIPLDDYDIDEPDAEAHNKPVPVAPTSQKFVVWTESLGVSKPRGHVQSPGLEGWRRNENIFNKGPTTNTENNLLKTPRPLPGRGQTFHQGSPTEKLLYFKHPASSDISNFNPPFNSTSLRKGSDLSEFKPQRCSTARNEFSFVNEFIPQRCSTAQNDQSFVSEFKPPLSSTALQGSPAPFKPLRFSGSSDVTSFNPLLSSTKAECGKNLKTPLEKNDVFAPLRSSTGLNESAVFNPLLSSTAYKIDDSNIPEFKYLMLQNKNDSVKK